MGGSGEVYSLKGVVQILSPLTSKESQKKESQKLHHPEGLLNEKWYVSTLLSRKRIPLLIK